VSVHGFAQYRHTLPRKNAPSATVTLTVGVRPAQIRRSRAFISTTSETIGKAMLQS
jgi:hypothetical protein